MSSKRSPLEFEQSSKTYNLKSTSYEFEVESPMIVAMIVIDLSF